MYKWKCHNEIPCIATLNKEKCIFSKNKRQEGKMGHVWELIPVRGERI
jgi:hypothetical protein